MGRSASSGHRIPFAFSRDAFIAVFVVVLALSAGLWSLWDIGIIGDEKWHAQQIERFLAGDFRPLENMTMPTTYHAIIAGMAWLTGLTSLFWLRIFTLSFSIGSIVVFSRLARMTHASSSAPRTLQFIAFPILFPFFFLVYTDVASLFFCLLFFLFVLQRKSWAAGAVGGAGLLIRQNTIVWVFLGFALLLLDDLPRYSGDVSLRGLRRYAFQLWKQCAAGKWLRMALKKYATFFLVFALFAVFMAANRGIALGDQDANPFPSIHWGNVYFLLFLFFVAFLPSHIKRLPRIIRLLKKDPLVALCCIGAFLVFYLVTFVNDHPYNQASLIFLLRTKLLLFFSADLWGKLILFLTNVVALLSLCVTRLHKPGFALLYPLTVIGLIPFWLIEQRYYLVPFSLYLLFSKAESRRAEYATVAIFALCTLWLQAGIVQGKFFL